MLKLFTNRHLPVVVAACLVVTACSDGSSIDPNSPQTGSTEIAGDAAPGTESIAFDDDSFFLTIGRHAITKTNAKAGRTIELLDPPTGVEYISPGEIVGNYWIGSTDTNYFVIHNVNTGDFVDEAFMGGRDSVFESPSAVVCAERLCYVMNNVYDLFAFEIFPESNPFIGALIWKKSLFDHEDRDLNIAQIVVAKDHIYIAGDMDQAGTTSIWAVNRFTQEIDQSTIINSPAFGTPLVTDTKIIVPVGEALVALNIETFETLWVADFSGTNGLYRTSTPSIAGSVVAVSSFVLENPSDDNFDRRHYVGVDVNTGSILWSTDVGDAGGFQFAPQSNGVNFFGAVTEVSNTLGFRSRRGDPIAIEAATGRVLWTRDDFVKNSPLAVGDRVYFVDMFENSGLVGLSASTGEVVYNALGSVGQFPATTALYHNGQIHRYSWTPSYKP